MVSEGSAKGYAAGRMSVGSSIATETDRLLRRVWPAMKCRAGKQSDRFIMDTADHLHRTPQVGNKRGEQSAIGQWHAFGGLGRDRVFAVRADEADQNAQVISAVVDGSSMRNRYPPPIGKKGETWKHLSADCMSGAPSDRASGVGIT